MSFVSVPLVHNVLRYAIGRGVSRAALLEHSSLREEDLVDLDDCVPYERMYALLEYVVRELEEPSLPVNLAESTVIENLHVMGFAVMTSSTARESLERAVRYWRLLADGSWELEEDGEDAVLRWVGRFPKRLGERVSDECKVASFLHHTRECSGVHVIPSRVCFRHAAPADLTRHREFFGIDPRFSESEVEFRFRLADISDKVGIKANPELNDYFVRQAETRLQDVDEGAGIVVRTRDAISRALSSGEPSCESIARRLATSERNLRRSLSGEGTSFRKLVAEVRQSRAELLLKRPRTTITQIAFLLGFSDASAFSRAFRRWCGVSPQAFRAAAVGPSE